MASLTRLTVDQMPLFSTWPLQQASLGCSHGGVFRELPMARESKPQCTSAFQASACVLFADVPFAKTSHVATPRLNGGAGVIEPY